MFIPSDELIYFQVAQPGGVTMTRRTEEQGHDRCTFPVLPAKVANDPRVAACMALERDIEALGATTDSFLYLYSLS